VPPTEPADRVDDLAVADGWLFVRGLESASMAHGQHFMKAGGMAPVARITFTRI